MRCKRVPGLSKRLRDAILTSGYSVLELQKLTGIDHSMITRYMNEEYTPSVWTLAALAKAMKVSLDNIVYGEV